MVELNGHCKTMMSSAESLAILTSYLWYRSQLASASTSSIRGQFIHSWICRLGDTAWGSATDSVGKPNSSLWAKFAKAGVAKKVQQYLFPVHRRYLRIVICELLDHTQGMFSSLKNTHGLRMYNPRGIHICCVLICMCVCRRTLRGYLGSPNDWVKDFITNIFAYQEISNNAGTIM